MPVAFAGEVCGFGVLRFQKLMPWPRRLRDRRCAATEARAHRGCRVGRGAPIGQKAKGVPPGPAGSFRRLAAEVPLAPAAQFAWRPSPSPAAKRGGTPTEGAFRERCLAILRDPQARTTEGPRGPGTDCGARDRQLRVRSGGRSVSTSPRGGGSLAS